MKKEKRLKFFPIQDYIKCGHKISEKAWDFSAPYHRHDAYEIYLFIQGNVNMYIEDACYHLQHGDMFIIAPNEFHRSVCFDEVLYERVWINIKKTLLDILSSNKTNLSDCFEFHLMENKNHVRLSNDEIKKFLYLVTQIQNCLTSEAYGNDLMFNAYTIQLMVLVNSLYKEAAYEPQSIMSTLVRDIIRYIKEHINGEITLQQLSDHFYLSGDYLSRQFKKHTGLTLRSYILDERIANAKNILSCGSSVTEACLQSGFSDYSNFIRSFTKIVGISPGKYRKINKTVPKPH